MFKIISLFSQVVLKAEILSYHSVEIPGRWGCSMLGDWWWEETFKAANAASVQISMQTSILCLQTWDWKPGKGFFHYVFNITYYRFCPELGGKEIVAEEVITTIYIWLTSLFYKTDFFFFFFLNYRKSQLGDNESRRGKSRKCLGCSFRITQWCIGSTEEKYWKRKAIMFFQLKILLYHCSPCCSHSRACSYRVAILMEIKW